MSSRDKRDVRRVQAEFEFDDAGGGRRGWRDRGDREREPQPVQIQGHVQGRAGRRREAFGGHLSVTEGTQTPRPTSVPSGRASPIRDDIDPLVAERQAAFFARLQILAPNPNNAVAAVKAAMRGYRANESSARDLISTVWNVLDQNLDDTASVINGTVDLLDEEEKKRDLLAAWNGFKVEQRQQFPDLTPTGVGSGYAGIASGRVLNAKHATASRSSQQSSRQVWDRVARAANASSSSSLFPPLAGPSSSFVAAPVTSSGVHSMATTTTTTTGGFRKAVRQTPWASGSGSSGGGGAGVLGTPVSVASGARSSQKRDKEARAGRPPVLSTAAFPELPTTGQPRMKPVVGGNASLRNILGETTPATPAWKANGSGASEGGPVETQGGSVPETPTKGKKSKGKQKQTLFTLGSFPA